MSLHFWAIFTSWKTHIRHWAAFRVHSSWAHHVFTTIHWTMIIAISTFHWDTSISRSLFSSFGIPCSRAYHFFFPVTISRAKFSWNAVISIFTSISMCMSRAHHIPILTGLWAMSSALSILVRYTKICRSLFSSFGIPCSRAHHFLFPVTVNWTKFAIVTEIWVFASISMCHSRTYHV